MLTLAQLYQQLRDVELFYEPVGTRELNDRDYEIINSYISGALDYMYSRFALKTQDIILCPLAGKTDYLISSKYAVSNTASSETKYIQDSSMKPFTDDWLLLLDCYDEMGRQIPINNQNRLMNCHRFFYFLKFCHHILINMQTTCCIEDYDIISILCCMFHRSSGNIRRFIFISH